MKKYNFKIISAALLIFTGLAAWGVSAPIDWNGRIVKGTFQAGNITVNTNTVATTNTNGDVIFDLNGTGRPLFTDLTASTVPYLDSSKRLQSSATTDTQLGYLGNATGNLCGIAQSCVLTNKSIDADTNTLTNIENADIKAAAAIAVNKLAALTVSRAVVSDGSGFLTASTTTAAEILHVNGVTSSLCGINQSCTETNKTFTSPAINGANFNFGTASNTNRLLLPSDTTTNLDGYTDTAGLIAYDTTQSKPVYNNGAAWVAVGSGAGGDKNYIGNPDAEAGTTGWATYKDAAGVAPVDCTGGSPSMTWTSATDTGLSGAKLFNRNKQGLSNQQGEGASYDFTIDNADKAKVFSIELDYKPNTSDFTAGTSTTDSDMEIYIYDVTNGAIIQPTTYKLYSSATSPPAKYVGNFQTASNSTSYRLCVHTATTNTANYQIYFDSFRVGPSKYVYGTPITDWESWTPTGSWSANSTYTGMRRRVGDTLELQFQVTTTGAPTSATLEFNLPTGLTMNSSKVLAQAGDNDFPTLGYCNFLDAGVAIFNGVLGSSDLSTKLTPKVSSTGGTYAANTTVTQAVPFTFGNTDGVTCYAWIPINGWSSSVQMSDNADQRVVAAYYYITSGASQTLNTAINYPTKGVDTHSAMSSGTYTVPVPGKYRVSHTTYSSSGTGDIYLAKNGTNVQWLGSFGATSIVYSGSTLIDCNAGDTLSLRSSVTYTAGGLVSSVPVSSISIDRLSGPETIGATETIAFRAYSTAGATITNGNTSTIVFGTEADDSHGAYNTSTGEFTAPVSGRYQFNSCAEHSASTGTGTRIIMLYKNGSEISRGGRVSLPSSTLASLCVSDQLKLNAGDIITVRFENTSGQTVTFQTSVSAVWFSGFRVGL